MRYLARQMLYRIGPRCLKSYSSYFLFSVCTLTLGTWHPHTFTIAASTLKVRLNAVCCERNVEFWEGEESLTNWITYACEVVNANGNNCDYDRSDDDCDTYDDRMVIMMLNPGADGDASVNLPDCHSLVRVTLLFPRGYLKSFNNLYY